jgi:hypothetical protein
MRARKFRTAREFARAKPDETKCDEELWQRVAAI